MEFVMIRHIATFVSAAVVLAGCTVTVVESPEHERRAGPTPPRASAHHASDGAHPTLEAPHAADGQRKVQVFRAQGPEGGRSQRIAHLEDVMRARRTASAPLATLGAPPKNLGAALAGAGCEAACARLQKLCGKCESAPCKSAIEAALKCCAKDLKGDDAEAARLACLRACAVAAAECKSCRKAMARCAAACANSVAGGFPGAMMLGAMDGEPVSLELGDLVLNGEGAEVCIGGECEMTCEVDEQSGATTITVNGERIELDKADIAAGGPVRARLLRLAPVEGGETKAIVVEAESHKAPKILRGDVVLNSQGHPHEALEKAKKQIAELKEALKAAEENLAGASEAGRPEAEKKLKDVRAKLDAARKHIESLRRPQDKEPDSEKKTEGELKAAKVIRLGGG
jgi:tellurite resistance protein